MLQDTPPDSTVLSGVSSAGYSGRKSVKKIKKIFIKAIDISYTIWYNINVIRKRGHKKYEN